MRLISEFALAVCTVWQEARGEPYEGKVAIGEVIRNRMRRKYSSDGSVADTVLRPFQFSGFNTQDPNRIPSFRIDDSDPVVQECIQAWMLSEQSNTVKGALLYLNPTAVTKEPKWVSLSAKVAKIGGHVFYEPL